MQEPTSSRIISCTIGVVVRRRPSGSVWQKWSWQPLSVILNAPEANWKEIQVLQDFTDFLVSPATLTLYRTDVEAYLTSLSMNPPSLFIVLRKRDMPQKDMEYDLHAVTLSAYEAQDHCDAGDELVESVAMPQQLIAWADSFIASHHNPKPFVKRQRQDYKVKAKEDGVGDARVRQAADVYRLPHQLKQKLSDNE